MRHQGKKEKEGDEDGGRKKRKPGRKLYNKLGASSTTTHCLL